MPPTTPAAISVTTLPVHSALCAEAGAVVAGSAAVVNVNAAAPVRIFDLWLRLLLIQSARSGDRYVFYVFRRTVQKGRSQSCCSRPPFTHSRLRDQIPSTRCTQPSRKGGAGCLVVGGVRGSSIRRRGHRIHAKNNRPYPHLARSATHSGRGHQGRQHKVRRAALRRQHTIIGTFLSVQLVQAPLPLALTSGSKWSPARGRGRELRSHIGLLPADWRPSTRRGQFPVTSKTRRKVRR